MRRLIAWDLMTLDGFFEGSKPWDLDFHERVWGAELEAFSLRQLEEAGALIFGRRTYDGMAAHWTSAEGAIADGMNRIDKFVFSNTLERADWENTRLVRERAEDFVPRLKEGDGGNLFVFGSAELTDALLDAGLVDEFRIALSPVVLGRGAPLFKARDTPIRWNLLEARPIGDAAVLLRYALQ